MVDLYVNQEFLVWWSNGAGYSIYMVVDNPGSGPHQLLPVRHMEVASDGTYAEITIKGD